MALMSTRIPLEFNGRTLRSQDMERLLVEKHMRVCLNVDQGFETAVTIAPSEPILSEAAYHIMRSPAFDLPRSLLTELEHPGLDKGSRGELIVMVLCLQAWDAAADRLQNRITPVIDFIQELITPEAHSEVFSSMPIRARTLDEANRTLEATFHESMMYFNHFIKLHDHEVINQKYLWRLIARGAAGICADFQFGIDVIIPFLYRDNKLQKNNVSAFFIQSKNDKAYQTTPQNYLFDMMDPYKIQFFDKDDKETTPVIRMVFALGSSTSCVAALKPAERTQPSREHGFKALFQANRYTAFDIWCAKASQETFRPIKEDIIFNKLLLRSGIFPEVYDTKNLEAIQIATRTMNPATSVNSAHWKQFVEETEP